MMLEAECSSRIRPATPCLDRISAATSSTAADARVLSARTAARPARSNGDSAICTRPKIPAVKYLVNMPETAGGVEVKAETVAS